MSTLPLFYRSVVPLDRHAHRTWRLAQPQSLAFARGSHLVPALVDEIGAACRHLPVVFLPESAGPVAVFLVGAAPGHCALVDEAGAWTARYLPAYLRRFPFILGEGEGVEPVICVDAESGLLLADATAGEGLALFAEDGGATPLLQERIRLTSDYAEAARRTAAFGRLLQDLGILRPLTISLQHPATGETHTLHGVLGVDEAALADLPEAAFVQLRNMGFLAAVYAHLISLRAISDFLLPSAAAQAAARSPRGAEPALTATTDILTDDAA